MERRAETDIVPAGITAGVVAGAVMIAAEMGATRVLGGTLESPLRLAASVSLGSAALAADYPFVSAAVAGAGLHLVLSAFYGVVALGLLRRAHRLDAGFPFLLLFGAVFGAAVWVLDDLLLGSFVFRQFVVVSPIWTGLIAHALCFGVVLGGYVALTRPGREVS